MVFFLENITIKQSKFKSNEDNSQNVTCRLCTAFEDGRPTFPAVLYCADVQLVVKQLNHFITTKTEALGMFAYWMSFTEMVDTLLQFVRRMLRWLFAYDRIYSSRFVPIYWLQMLHLPTTNPANINDHLVAGEFVTQATQRIAQPFSQTLMDQTQEQTL